MPGPPPKHPSQRRRRNVSPGWQQLPAEGRKGDPPEWPLTRPTKAEVEMWAQLWATPQAVAWQRLGWTRTVARYCRMALEAERRNAIASLRNAVAQLEKSIGLTPSGMRHLCWEIVADEVGEARDTGAKARPTARARLKVVDPDAVSQ